MDNTSANQVADLVMSEDAPKTCRYCGKEMFRKLKGHKIESPKQFSKRIYCDNVCMGKDLRR